MSIDRKQVSNKFSKLIQDKYKGNHKKLLLYLTPVIFENNPAENCYYKCNERIRKNVPERRKMKVNSEFGMAIGNLTSQAGSNLNLSNFDSYVVNDLKLDKYVRYVDDIVIVSNDKRKLINALPKIEEKLKESHQSVNLTKTKIDTAYHGVPFLGKISYPYGYQIAKKTTIIRTYYKAKTVTYTSTENLLSKINSQIGTLKKYNCRKLIINYAELLNDKIENTISFDEEKLKFNQNRLFI